MQPNQIIRNCLCACLLAACAGALPLRAQTPNKPSNPPAVTAPGGAAGTPAADVDPEYLLGPGDVVAIDVWHEPEISRSLPIRPDGRLSLPLAGQLQAQGLTTAQLKDEITKRLEKYINQPAVTVMLQQAVSRRYNILGKVGHPGSVVLTHPTTILDAIAEAGGLAEFASGGKIYLLRKRASDGVVIRYNFNYKKVSLGVAPKENILVQPDDTIIVP